MKFFIFCILIYITIEFLCFYLILEKYYFIKQDIEFFSVKNKSTFIFQEKKLLSSLSRTGFKQILSKFVKLSSYFFYFKSCNLNFCISFFCVLFAFFLL